MLTPHDDFPLHQASVPIASPTDGDANRYDRYFFHGYDPDASVFFGAALGVYPNRNIIDAAFGVGDGTTQRSVFASSRLPADPTQTRVGPITVEIVEPLRTLRVHVDAPDQGLAANVRFDARSIALEEPRQVMTDRGRTILDSTRLTQHGTWTGSISVASDLIDLGEGMAGTRDRSWGVRPLAGAVPEAPATELPAFFWMWAPMQLADRCLLLGIMEDEHGVRSTSNGAVLFDIGDGPAWNAPDRVHHARRVDYDITWRSGTRRAQSAELTFTMPWGERIVASLEPSFPFLLRGLGYTNPEWPHGAWHGEDAVGGEVLQLADLDPLDVPNIHVHQACRVRVGDELGVGVLEQLHFGPHRPSGLSGFLDGAP